MTEEYRVTGLMSGTSLDGVDLACCLFSLNEGRWDFEILQAETVPYPPDLQQALATATEWDLVRIYEHDFALGEYYAGLLNDFHRRHGLQVDLIASHGHTILHEPEKGITFQAGHGGTMADRTGKTVVTDFRSEDVAQGGQGAPLVPVGDLLLFGKYDACVNLGGFANISYDTAEGSRVACDIGPANLALNWISGLQGKPFDKDGQIASAGRIDPLLLDHLNTLEYYGRKSPKSLGKEWFNREFLPLLRQWQGSVEDLMATVVEHIALQLAFSTDMSGAASVLVTGGGALNTALIERYTRHCRAELIIPPGQLAEFKEALIFAFLGLLRVLGRENILASVTGGRSNLSAGTIHRIIKT
jgi:anhydro-N-acetylmuramic acid kinase